MLCLWLASLRQLVCGCRFATNVTVTFVPVRANHKLVLFQRDKPNEFYGAWQLENVSLLNAASFFAPIPVADLASESGRVAHRYATGSVVLYGCNHVDGHLLERQDLFGARQSLVAVSLRDGIDCPISVTATPTYYEVHGNRLLTLAEFNTIQSAWLRWVDCHCDFWDWDCREFAAVRWDAARGFVCRR